MTQTPKKLLLVGATGLVGRHVLQRALADPRVDTIVAPTRRALPMHARLSSPPVDYERLDEEAGWWRADAVICTLGTTLRTAGSEAAFRRVDHDYPLAVARWAHAHGTPTYVLNSAIGADAASRFFYNRVKGELENALRQVGFDALTLVRPGVIGGHRDEFRLGERVIVSALRVAGPLLPRRWRLNPAANIARSLLEAALAPQPGVRVIASEKMA
ncbi:NAD(P)H-binding protein [Variovorax sp. E3]|uniref:NAD(P)H-binding protein n=1 Tax=Variovorax sp. E3 TaxID=1914993 RepID=UPI0018DB5510|nr:NAD(P)H-binding protein [Variovorax sp. E3]